LNKKDRAPGIQLDQDIKEREKPAENEKDYKQRNDQVEDPFDQQIVKSGLKQLS
jgi:hypothetical protein